MLDRIRSGVEKKRLAMAMLISMKIAEGLSPNLAHAESAADYDPMAGLEATPDASGPEAKKRHEEKRAELLDRIAKAKAPEIPGAKKLFSETVSSVPGEKPTTKKHGEIADTAIEARGTDGIAIAFIDARHRSDIVTQTQGDGGAPSHETDVRERAQTDVYELPAHLEAKGEPLTFEIDGVGANRTEALLQALRAASHHLDAEMTSEATWWESTNAEPADGGVRETTTSEDDRYDATESVAYLESFRVIGEAPTVGGDAHTVTVHLEVTGYGKTMIETPEAPPTE